MLTRLIESSPKVKTKASAYFIAEGGPGAAFGVFEKGVLTSALAQGGSAQKPSRFTVSSTTWTALTVVMALTIMLTRLILPALLTGSTYQVVYSPTFVRDRVEGVASGLWHVQLQDQGSA
jgi:hypothetical protein